MTGATATEADYEAALAQVAALVGRRLLVLWYAGDLVLGGVGGELVDAMPSRAGTAAEAIIFRLHPRATFNLDREAFRGWRLHLGETEVAGIDLHLEGGAMIRLTTYEAAAA